MQGGFQGFSRFHAEQNGVHYSGLVRRGFTAAAALCAKLDFPEITVCKECRKVKSTIVDGYFLKRYNLPGLWNQFRRHFRTGRPMIALICAQAFEKAGVSTPKVLAALTEKSADGHRDILITEVMAPDLRTADTFFPLPGRIDGGWNELAAAVFPLLVKLHDSGIAHGDLNIRNLCCAKDLTRWGMIDLDGGVCGREPLALAMREKELARLASSFVRAFPPASIGALAADCAARYARLSALRPDTNRIWKRMEHLLNL